MGMRWLAAFSLALVMVVIALGAWTRLADAGLGCPDWPGCYGFATVPTTEGEIALAQSRYPATPFEADKALLEVVHRYFAASIGLLIVALLALSLRSGDRGLIRLAAAAFVVVCIQGFLGYLTVDLKLLPQVVVAHLFGGLLTMALLWLIVLRLFSDRLPVVRWRRWPLASCGRWLIILALAVTVLQIGLGGWVSANYAALACPELPTCQGQWLPPADYGTGFSLTQPPGPNYLHGRLTSEARTAIHLAHRFGAVLVLLVLGALSVALLRDGYRRLGALLLALLGIQWGLGLSNVYFALPLAVAVAHNLGAAALLLVLLFLLSRCVPNRV